MRSWKRKTRAQHKAILRIADQADSKHLSRWAVRRWGKDDVNSWEPWGSKLWRKDYFKRMKDDRKAVKQAMKKFAEFPYYEDCRYHPCEVTSLDPNYDWRRIDIEGKSLINGSPGGCSYFNCGVIHLTKEEGEERAKFAIMNGMLAYQMKYVYPTATGGEETVNLVRYLITMEEQWAFTQNNSVEFATDIGKQWMIDNLNIVVDDLVSMSTEELEKIR